VIRTAPDAAAFAARYRAGEPQVLWTELVADLETPVSAMLKLADGLPNSFLMESVEGGATRGRYSFIGLKPDLIWRCRDGRAEINRRARTEAGSFVPEAAPPLESLAALIRESRIDLPAELPPMASGLVGYMGYDMVRLVERLPDDRPDPVGAPDALLIRPTIIAVFDNVKDEIIVVTPVRPDGRLKAKTAYTRACDRLSATIDKLDNPLPHAPGPNGEKMRMACSNMAMLRLTCSSIIAMPGAGPPMASVMRARTSSCCLARFSMDRRR